MTDHAAIFNTVLTIYLAVCLFAWVYFYAAIAFLNYRLPVIDNFIIRNESENVLPRLSIIVTACNEEKTILPALRSLLDQDYPDFEVIAVNDRSSDRTGEILENMAKTDSRVRAIHIQNLPDQWLGKVHALSTASAHAKGEWILFTDADVHYSTDILRKCVSHAIVSKLDHLTVSPRMIAGSFPLEIMFRTFAFMFYFFSGAVPGFLRKNLAIGIGAFNLVRKSALDKTVGFSWLRMEVADDVGLALMLKRSGAKSDLAVSLKDISVRWYHSVLDMSRGLEKNIFGVSTGYRFSISVVHFLLISILTVAPIVAIYFSNNVYLEGAGVFTLFSFFISILIHSHKFNESFLPSLFIPFGLVALTLITLRAGILCIRRGGIEWRGTFYKIEDLKKGQRVNTGV